MLPATSPRGAPAPRPTPPTAAPTGALVVLPGLLLLGAAGALAQVGWLMVWVVSYRLTHGNDFTYTYLVRYERVWEKLYDLLLLANRLVPGIEPPRDLNTLVYTLVVGFLVVALGYLVALWLLDQGLAWGSGALAVLLGFSALYQATLFLMPGIYTTDVSSYVMYGHIAGVYGLNPYVVPPAAFPGNPLVAWIHPIWQNTPTIYGPLWTTLGAALARPIEPLSLADRVLAYKALMGAIHLVNLALVWWLLGRLFPPRGAARLAAFALFAWNPVVLFEVVGNAHNDGLMVTLLLLGMVPLVSLIQRDAWRANLAPQGSLAWASSVVFVGLSALVKYTSGLAGLFHVVAWARQVPSWRARAAWIGGTGLLVLGMGLALFAPWLQREALAPILDVAGGKNYTNSLPDLAALTIVDTLLDPPGGPDTSGPPLDRAAAQETARAWTKLLTRGAFVLYLGWEARRLWRLAAPPAAARQVVQGVLEASVRAFLVLLLGVLTWVLAWYFTWPLALATLLGWRHLLARVVVGFTLTSLPVFYVHHYWSVNMPGWLLFLYVVPPLAVPLAFELRSRRAERSRRASRPPTDPREPRASRAPEASHTARTAEVAA